MQPGPGQIVARMVCALFSGSAKVVFDPRWARQWPTLFRNVFPAGVLVRKTYRIRGLNWFRGGASVLRLGVSGHAAPTAFMFTTPSFDFPAAPCAHSVATVCREHSTMS